MTGSRSLAPAAALVLIGLVAGGPGRVSADVLYVMNGDGVLRLVDPATGQTVQKRRLEVPGQVVTHGAGLGLVPGTDVAYALVGLGDACELDPSRTFVGGGSDGCTYGSVTPEGCESTFAVLWDGEPRSCHWDDGWGCDLGPGENTCLPPPTCVGAARTWAGFGATACGQFDGDAIACEASYQADADGTRSCFSDAGACAGCTPARQAAGACVNACGPPAPCLDGSRDIAAGPYGCHLLSDDAAACARAFEWGDAAVAPEAIACVVGTDGWCTRCDRNAEAAGFCQNTCATPPACPGDPTRIAVPACFVHDADPTACAAAYTWDAVGAHACYAGATGCHPCHEQAERRGDCLDVCVPPVCAADPARTALLARGEDCGGFDGDAVGCAGAYFVGRCGTSSCAYDVDAGTCRPCALSDPARCDNACGPFDPLGQATGTPALVTVDLESVAATVIGRPGDWFRQPVPDGTGAVHALSTFSWCVEPHALHRFDPGSVRPLATGWLDDGGGGALALHPADGRLFRFASGGLSATDPVTGLTTAVPVDVPAWFEPRAMTWAPACDAFLVADWSDGLWRLDPAAGTLAQTVLRLPSECDEGNCAVGLAIQGTSVCPPLEWPTFTTTTTTTSTSSSSTTSTMPSELVTGARLVLTDRSTRLATRRLVVRSDDPALSPGGGPGSADDPLLHGGSLQVVSSSGSFDSTYPLDGAWRRLRRGGWAWRDDGAVREVVLRTGRLEIRGRGAGLGQSLLLDPGSVRVVLRLGGRRWCLEFGGTFDTRTPRKLAARRAPAPVACAGS